MEVDDNISLIVGDPWGILDKQLRPRPINKLFNIVNSLVIDYVKLLNNILFIDI